MTTQEKEDLQLFIKCLELSALRNSKSSIAGWIQDAKLLFTELKLKNFYR